MKEEKFLAGSEDLHTDQGYIKNEEIQSSSPGDMLETHIGHKFRVLDANINDYIELMDRRCSQFSPKIWGLWHLLQDLEMGIKW